MQKVRYNNIIIAVTACKQSISGSFHSCLVLFTFPSQYLYTIDIYKYLGFDGGPPIFKQDFTYLVLLYI